MPKIMVAAMDVLEKTQLEEQLTSLGYEVVGRASSGNEAIEMAKSLMPDLILMDIVMPGKLDGIDA
ncbi:MAG: response regulator, partial [Methanophagales archaeon]|nr:response regulator [Methanophagales archaeon]